MTDLQKEKCFEILKHYGFEHQREILVEELAELIQAVSKAKRNNTRVSSNFIEELADVSIMLEQMQQALTADEYIEFLTIQNRKIERQLARIKGQPERNCFNCWNDDCLKTKDKYRYCGNWQPRRRKRV